MKKILLSFSIIILGLSVIGGSGLRTSYADNGQSAQYTLLTPLPCIPYNAPGCSGGVQSKVNIQGYVLYIFKLAIAIAVFLAVVMITFAGFKYMTEESISGKGAARKMISNAVLGLLGALGSWLILYTINPQLVNLSLITVPDLKLTSSSTILTTSSLQNDLNTQSKALAKNITNTIDQNATTYAAQQAAQSSLDALGDSLVANGCVDQDGNDISNGDPDCAADEKDYSTKQAQLTELKNRSVVTKTAGIMATEYEQVLGASQTQISPIYGGSAQDSSQYRTTELDALTNVKSQYTAALSQLGNDATEKMNLTDQKNYYQASIINEYQTELIINLLTQKNNQGNTTLIASAQELIGLLQTGGATETPDGDSIGKINDSTLSAQFNSENKKRITEVQAAIATAKGKSTSN